MKREAGPLIARLTFRREGRRGQKYMMKRWCDEHDKWRRECGCREEK